MPLTPTEHLALKRKLLRGEAILPSTPSTPSTAVLAGLTAAQSSALALSPEHAPSTTPQETPALTPQQQECRDFRASLPANFTQDFVTVPENWDEPRSDATRMIRVYYYARLVRDARGTLVRPTVFFNGGPAGSSHSSYEVLEEQAGAATLSLIYVDQRGTGCSDPYPSSPVTLETARRLALYGSRAIVRDAEAIRERLLGPATPWRAFGQSYGGNIVHRYLTLAPASLEAAFIHGNAVVSDPADKMMRRLLSQRRISRAYLARYPGDEKRLRAIRAAIREDRCFDDGYAKVCGAAVADAAAGLLGFTSEWESLHEWITRLSSRIGKPGFEPSLQEFVRTIAFGIYSGGESSFAGNVLSHLDVVPGYTDVAVCTEATARIARQASASATTSVAGTEPPQSWPINECRLLSALHATGEQFVGASHPGGDPIDLAALKSQLDARKPAPRFFLYSGALDSFVPSEIFAEETRSLGTRVTYTRFPESGHEGFYAEPQVWRDLNSR